MPAAVHDLTLMRAEAGRLVCFTLDTGRAARVVALAEYQREDGDIGTGPRYGWGHGPTFTAALAHVREQNYRAPRWAVFEMLERYIDAEVGTEVADSVLPYLLERIRQALDRR